MRQLSGYRVFWRDSFSDIEGNDVSKDVSREVSRNVSRDVSWDVSRDVSCKK